MTPSSTGATRNCPVTVVPAGITRRSCRWRGLMRQVHRVLRISGVWKNMRASKAFWWSVYTGFDLRWRSRDLNRIYSITLYGIINVKTPAVVHIVRLISSKDLVWSVHYSNHTWPAHRQDGRARGGDVTAWLLQRSALWNIHKKRWSFAGRSEYIGSSCVPRYLVIKRHGPA